MVWRFIKSSSKRRQHGNVQWQESSQWGLNSSAIIVIGAFAAGDGATDSGNRPGRPAPTQLFDRRTLSLQVPRYLSIEWCDSS